MEGWQFELGRIEGCQGIISSSAGRVCHLQPHTRCTSICLLGTIRDEEEQSYPGKSQVKVLAKVTQGLDQDRQVCRGGKESRQSEWKYSWVGCNLQRNAQHATSILGIRGYKGPVTSWLPVHEVSHDIRHQIWRELSSQGMAGGRRSYDQSASQLNVFVCCVT